MKLLSTEAFKKIQLEILIDIHEFCVKNNIKYFLAYGTLIGAIRHEGFIPWDDDIDICMPRPDYMRFAELYNHSKYNFYCPEKTKNFPYIHGKVSDDSTIVIENTNKKFPIGVNIDVFPIDGLSSDYLEAKKHYESIVKTRNIINIKKISFSTKRKISRNLLLLILKLLTIIIPFNKAIKDLNGKMRKYDYNNSKYVGELCFGDSKRVLEKTLFETIVLHKFEGYDFYIPIGYDKWLKTIFKDYMQLPPEEKRITHHDFTVYRK